ncbi:hypothetical protein [Paenibacillus monticola]|uniref:hypothetical protein n=1 Tax=Paenibacillus monticola TaxID=2666075 RepID=UPI001E4C8900|nr:hypothetical protein [Paenibacillus monticola]
MKVRFSDVPLSKIIQRKRYPCRTNSAVGFQRGNDMESLAVTGVDDFFARVPAVHENIDTLVLLG